METIHFIQSNHLQRELSVLWMLAHLLTIAPLEAFVLLRNTKTDYVCGGRWAEVRSLLFKSLSTWRRFYFCWSSPTNERKCLSLFSLGYTARMLCTTTTAGVPLLERPYRQALGFHADGQAVLGCGSLLSSTNCKKRMIQITVERSPAQHTSNRHIRGTTVLTAQLAEPMAGS